MKSTRLKIEVITDVGGSMVSWETVDNFTEILDQEIDYAAKYDKIIAMIIITQAGRSWVT